MLTAIRRYRRVFDAAGNGHLTLPGEVDEARATADRLDAALGRVQPPEPAEVLFDTAVTAALDAPDPTVVDVGAVTAHTRDVQEHDTRIRILRAAAERADAELLDVMLDARERIITECMRPAGERVWSEVEKCTTALAEVEPLTADTLLRAPDRARKGWLALDTHAAVFDQLRAAYTQVFDEGQLEHDVSGDHGLLREGMCTAFGPNWRGTPTSERPTLPWPDGTAARLVWLCRRNLVPWWPLPTERDGVWLSAHREQYELMQRRQQLHHTAHAWAG